ncbi:hypothetical protein WA158_008028 [Blastocystis sp. Blastoise]
MSTPDESKPNLSIKPEQRVPTWIKEQLNHEIERLKANGANCLPLPVKSISFINDGRDYFNRVDLNTSFDFNKLKMVIISDPIPCPHKPGYNYINVVLFTEKLKPMILPYIYDTSYASKGHTLKNWVFVNNQGEEAYHTIDSFEEI